MEKNGKRRMSSEGLEGAQQEIRDGRTKAQEMERVEELGKGY